MDARFVLVSRKTRLQELIERFNTRQQAQFYLEQAGADFADYHQEDVAYRAILTQAQRVLAPRGRLQNLERALLPSYRFHDEDIVVVIGQDGLVANTLKYLRGNPIIAINPDPARWDGVLLPFTPDDLGECVHGVLAGRATTKDITLAEARTNAGQVLTAVNDLFIGPKSHTSARYRLTVGNSSEAQSSSGIIVSTGLGSTGWLQSLHAGAAGIANLAPQVRTNPAFAWDARYLAYTVREPFPSVATGTSLVFGHTDVTRPMAVESLMPENGVIFSDGIEQDYLEFNAGTTVTIGLAEQQGCLVV